MSTESPQITICLPVYNASSFIEAALDSILNQSYGNFELLVADDGSTDNTIEILRKYCAQDPRIVFWQNEKNMGAVRNYNNCFKKARGNFIKPFAADDIMHKRHLEQLHNHLQENPTTALVSCARQIINDQGAASTVESSFEKSAIHDGTEIRRECLKRFVHVFNLIGEPSCVMFRKEHSGEGFDADYYHMTDLDLWIQILQHGNLYYITEPLCFYRKHENTTTNNNFKSLYYMLDFLRIVDKNIELCNTIYGSRENAFATVAEHLGRFVFNLTQNSSVENPQQQISNNLLDSRNPLLLQSGIKQNEVERPRTLTDQEYFRQLAFFALLRAGENATRLDSTYKDLTLKLESCEAELKGVYASKSWKSTKILRKFSRILKAK
ncbi:MAG: glycosyltransferase [Candidatus Obscuribacterales bacterium]|jgi:glycosyltransferase involved in cell wall biosynthesis|nr:glycosyltransferase [Candidatus Obscuribacterales bacterium]